MRGEYQDAENCRAAEYADVDAHEPIGTQAGWVKLTVPNPRRYLHHKKHRPDEGPPGLQVHEYEGA
jgi:hypothetical protein